jgi:transcription elongation GreA/GreB family factor
MPKGNAGDFSMGDMSRDQAEVSAASIQYEETGRVRYGSDQAKAEAIAKAARRQATSMRNGAVVSVRNAGSERKPNWTVIVEVPRGKGKKK